MKKIKQEEINKTAQNIKVESFSKEYLKKVADNWQELTDKELAKAVISAFLLKTNQIGKKSLSKKEIEKACEEFMILCGLEYLVKDGLLVGKGHGFERTYNKNE